MRKTIFYIGVGLISIALIFWAFYCYGAWQPEANEIGGAYNELQWKSAIERSPFRILFLLISSLALFVFSQFIAAPIASSKIRLAVVTLRSCSIAFLAIMFLEPSLRLAQVKTSPNTVAVLLDASLSMNLPADSTSTLHQKAIELIEKSNDISEQLPKEHLFDFYTFGDSLTKRSRQNVPSTSAQESQSSLLPALSELLKKYPKNELGGVVVISDGLVEKPAAFDSFSLGPNTAQFPIHSLVFNPPKQLDVAVDNVSTADFSFVRTVTRIDVELKQQSLQSETTLPLELYENGRLIRQKSITLSPNKLVLKDFFEVTPPHHGTFLYEIRLGTLKGERTDKNNSHVFSIKAIRDKIRVLHVAGRPSWDVRSFRGMLKQNSNIDLVSFFILRTPTDLKLSNDNELSLIPFPTRELFEEELQSFDIIILQNFDYEPYQMFRYLKNIKDYVAKGGGLIMVGGPLTFYDGMYQLTPLHDVLPIALPDQGSISTGWLDVEFQANVTSPSQPITSFLDNGSAGQSTSLPTMSGLNIIQDVKPNGQVIMNATSPQFPEQSRPLAVIGDYRDGRTLTMLTHSMWRWDLQSMEQSQLQNRHYYEFWDRSIRWLIKDPSLSSLQIKCQKLFYSPKERPSVEVVLSNSSTKSNPSPIELVLEDLRTKSKQHVKVGPSENGKTFHQFDRLPTGQYKAKVTNNDEESTCLFNVGDSTKEMNIPDDTPKGLYQLSQMTGGAHLVNPATIDNNLTFLPSSQKRVTAIKHKVLWNTPLILIGLLFCMSVDWLVRFKSGNL